MIFRKTFTFNFAIIYCGRTFTHFTTTTLVKRVKTVVLLSFTPKNYGVFTLMPVYDHCIIYSTVSKPWMIVLRHVAILRHQAVFHLKFTARLVNAIACSLADGVASILEEVVLVAISWNILVRGLNTPCEIQFFAKFQGSFAWNFSLILYFAKGNIIITQILLSSNQKYVFKRIYIRFLMIFLRFWLITVLLTTISRILVRILI